MPDANPTPSPPPGPSPPPRSLTRNPLALRRRLDLRSITTEHKHDAAVVVKDPVAMKYHRLRPDEAFVLDMLDGNATLDQIRSAYEAEYPPTKVTPAELNQLLFRFHQLGLTVSDVACQGDRLTDRRLKARRDKWIQQISGLLFIRFPGVDPEPLLGRIYPLVRPMLGRLGMSLAVALCMIAMVLVATRWEQFVGEFPAMSDWIHFRAVLILAAVIGVTKVLHELGHAIVCKHFGGECHQIGPMLLVFTPALYCDTSDSWMLPSRLQRAAVGLAGIATEVLLAALATIVWSVTAPGLVHYVAMNVILVCSISTLMFNANPLLRYDGYYVLSDLVDIPNLGEKSRRLLTSTFNHIVFGFDERATDPMSPTERTGLLGYAIAAFVYRWSLTVLILWMLTTLMRPIGLESIGRVFGVLAAAGTLFVLLRGPVNFFRNPARRRQMNGPRTAFSVSLMLTLVGLAFYPLPSGVSASAQIVPRNETPIYIGTSGRLVTLHRGPGDAVNEGDVIAVLENPDVQLQYLAAKGRFETQRGVVESLRQASLDSPEMANELPGQESLLEDFETQLATRKSRFEGLSITAPASGKLITAPMVPADRESQLAGRLVGWSGYPTDQKNHECFLEPGSELMSIVGGDDWDAEIALEQSQVERIAVGATVRLIVDSMPSRKFEGTVTEIARSQWDEIQNTDRRDDPRAARADEPLATAFMVRVAIDNTLGSDESSQRLALITGSQASVRIDAAEISIVGRVARMLGSLLRFR